MIAFAAACKVPYPIVNTYGANALNFQDISIPTAWQWAPWSAMAATLAYNPAVFLPAHGRRAAAGAPHPGIRFVSAGAI